MKEATLASNVRQTSLDGAGLSAAAIADELRPYRTGYAVLSAREWGTSHRIAGEIARTYIQNRTALDVTEPPAPVVDVRRIGSIPEDWPGSEIADTPTVHKESGLSWAVWADRITRARPRLILAGEIRRGRLECIGAIAASARRLGTTALTLLASPETGHAASVYHLLRLARWSGVPIERTDIELCGTQHNSIDVAPQVMLRRSRL